eukprot:6850693-Heterocapsa_arctica.AAC.1
MLGESLWTHSFTGSLSSSKICWASCPFWTATPMAICSLSAVERVTTGCVRLHVPISVPRKNAQPPDVD